MCIQGLMFLVYPLLGHLADVYLTRYRALKCGTGIIVTGVIGAVLCTLVTAIIDLHSVIVEYGGYTIGFIIGIGLTIGIGLFEANAIQFGLDQLLEAPTSTVNWSLSSTGTTGVRMLEDW